MHDASLWFGFVGAWLLVAGPVYQAVLELSAEEFERDRLRDAADEVPRKPVSPWWWLVPPVKWYLESKRRQEYQDDVVLKLSEVDYQALRSFVNKARGWFLVASGATLLAFKETYELAEDRDWPLSVFWLLTALMLVVPIGTAAGREAHDARIADRRKAASATG